MHSNRTFVKLNGQMFRPDPKPQPKEKKAPKPIKKMSAKLAKNTRIYSELRKGFLAQPENAFCFIKGCGRKASTIEHIMGREGFADNWARENDIPLLLDVRYFKPCCLHHNLELEINPKLSKKYQLSKIHGGKK